MGWWCCVGLWVRRREGREGEGGGRGERGWRGGGGGVIQRFLWLRRARALPPPTTPALPFATKGRARAAWRQGTGPAGSLRRARGRVDAAARAGSGSGARARGTGGRRVGEDSRAERAEGSVPLRRFDSLRLAARSLSNALSIQRQARRKGRSRPRHSPEGSGRRACNRGRAEFCVAGEGFFRSGG
jgi:hypothetical protein